MITWSLSSISIILSKSLRGCFTTSKFLMHFNILNNSCISLFLVKGNSDLKQYMHAQAPIWEKLGSVQWYVGVLQDWSGCCPYVHQIDYLSSTSKGSSKKV